MIPEPHLKSHKKKLDKAQSLFFPHPLYQVPVISVGFQYWHPWCCVWVPRTHSLEKPERLTRTSQIPSLPTLSTERSSASSRTLSLCSGAGPLSHLLTPGLPVVILAVRVQSCVFCSHCFILACPPPSRARALASSFRSAMRRGSFNEAFVCTVSRTASFSS